MYEKINKISEPIGFIHKLSGKRLITIWNASLSEAIPLIILDSEINKH